MLYYRRASYSKISRIINLLKTRTDLPLLIGLLLLSVCSLLMLYSTSHKNVDIVVKQCFNISIGFFLMLFISQIDPKFIFRIVPWLYILGVILLFSIFIYGDKSNGAQRWLSISIFRFQPSEVMKIVVPLTTAWYLHSKIIPPKFSSILVASVIILIPTVVIMKQPDLGTALLIGLSGMFVVFFSGLSWTIILIVVALVVISSPILWLFLHDYQRQRVLTFLQPELDPLGTGWNIMQSKIAIGSGGLFGKGWLQGTQSQFKFLPESSTDFVFSALCEEMGLLGVAVLLSIYLFIIIRALNISSNAQDTFTRLISAGLIMTFFIYIVVNISMVSGLLPVVGVPLPLISYGGSSIVTLFMSFGIIISIKVHRKLLNS